jgi:hypothetical protein
MTDHENKANNEDIGGEGIPTARYDGKTVGPGGKIGPCCVFLAKVATALSTWSFRPYMKIPSFPMINSSIE